MADEDVDSSNESSEERKNNDDEKISKRRARKFAWLSETLMKREHRSRVKRVSSILKKDESQRTNEDKEFLQHSPELTEKLTKSANRRDALKQRALEIHDPEEILEAKCSQLATAIKESKNIVIYTGAGISTAASIPDYRGPNGVWTLLQKGQQPKPQDLSDAEPTVTHMCILQLYKQGRLKHVVSQNCDGLHLRSGLPRSILSEVHGNMYIELCNHCKPAREYIRLFDVTEKTGVRRHQTGRYCHSCRKPLRDTIVHFGEKGGIKSPYRWKEAAKAADNCDLILCLGTSLKILKIYSCLWCMDRRPKQRPKLYIVNLQWTPKDDSSTLKISGSCDDVMQRIMDKLGYPIPVYSRDWDPIFRAATSLRVIERSTTSKKVLDIPPNYELKKRRRKPRRKEGIQEESSSQESQDSVHMGSVKQELKHEVTSNIREIIDPSVYTKILLQEKVLEATRTAMNTELLLPTSSSTIPQHFQSNQYSRNVPCLPLDLSMTGPHGRAKQSVQNSVTNEIRTFVKTEPGDIGEHKVTEKCPNCDVCQRLNIPCSCSLIQLNGSISPQLQNRNQGLNFLPMQNLPFIGLQLNVQHPLPPMYCSYPLSLQLPSDTSQVEDVLKDHCYLSKHQMKKLSPKQSRTESQTADHKTTSSAVVKRCISYTEGVNIKEDKDLECKTQSTSDQSECLKSDSACSDNKEESDQGETTVKKPKLCHSVSVPGWFGKGLNMKKKRRF